MMTIVQSKSGHVSPTGPSKPRRSRKRDHCPCRFPLVSCSYGVRVVRAEVPDNKRVAKKGGGGSSYENVRVPTHATCSCLVSVDSELSEASGGFEDLGGLENV